MHDKMNGANQTSKRLCEKCGQHEGDVYSFHYGKKMRGSTHLVGYNYKTS
jgi:hypothetical protein